MTFRRMPSRVKRYQTLPTSNAALTQLQAPLWFRLLNRRREATEQQQFQQHPWNSNNRKEANCGKSRRPHLQPLLWRNSRRGQQLWPNYTQPTTGRHRPRQHLPLRAHLESELWKYNFQQAPSEQSEAASTSMTSWLSSMRSRSTGWPHSCGEIAGSSPTHL